METQTAFPMRYIPPFTQSLVAERRIAPRSLGPLKNAMNIAPARQMAVPTILAMLLKFLTSTFSNLHEPNPSVD